MTEQQQQQLFMNESIRFVLGDCLTALDAVENKSVDMIYLDPPYDSGRDYTLNAESDLGFGDKWTGDEYRAFIQEVVQKCALKLKTSGTLFFHISADKMFIPETVLRAAFPLVQPIFWKKCRSKNNVKTKLGATIDVIFKCNLSKSFVFNLVSQAKDETYLKNSFKNADDRGNYSLGHIVTEPSKKGYMYEFEHGGKTFAPKAGWRIKREDLSALAADNRLHMPKTAKGNLYKKIYLAENPGKPCTDLWDDIHSLAQGNEERKYPTAKPVALLERMIRIATNDGDTILDPMCGSGTTGAATVAVGGGRKCVMMDKNPDAVEVLVARFNGDNSV